MPALELSIGSSLKFFAERVDKEAVSRLERFIDADFAQVDYTDAVTILAVSYTHLTADP